jgi:hypothetical protein
MHGLKYQLLPALLAAALLLIGFLPGHAEPVGLFGGSDAFLWFGIEQHPGKADWVGCWLDINGEFRVFRAGDTIVGKLPAQESRRILEEYEKICTAAGEHHFPPEVILFRGGLPRQAPYFIYRSAKGKYLALEGPQTLPPPELTAFLRILWQKLITHAAQNPSTAPSDPFAPLKLR